MIADAWSRLRLTPVRVLAVAVLMTSVACADSSTSPRAGGSDAASTRIATGQRDTVVLRTKRGVSRLVVGDSTVEISGRVAFRFKNAKRSALLLGIAVNNRRVQQELAAAPAQYSHVLLTGYSSSRVITCGEVWTNILGGFEALMYEGQVLMERFGDPCLANGWTPDDERCLNALEGLMQEILSSDDEWVQAHLDIIEGIGTTIDFWIGELATCGRVIRYD